MKCENKVNTYVNGDCCSHGKRMDFDGTKFVPRKKKGARALETFDLDALFKTDNKPTNFHNNQGCRDDISRNNNSYTGKSNKYENKT